MWNIFIEKEINTSIEFSKAIDIIIELTLPICRAIEEKKEYNETWDFKKLKYI